MPDLWHDDLEVHQGGRVRDQLTRDALGRYTAQSVRERFEAQHEPEPNSGCWLWTGVVDRLKYGSMEIDGRKAMAHRVAHLLYKGMIPPRLTIDHLCRNRMCVNPAHVEAVPQRVNVLRGVGIAARKTQQTHCDNGHEYTAQNTRRRKGRWRMCRACFNARRRGLYARQTATI